MAKCPELMVVNSDEIAGKHITGFLSSDRHAGARRHSGEEGMDTGVRRYDGTFVPIHRRIVLDIYSIR